MSILPFDVEVRFYDASGARLAFDPRDMVECEWELLENGGAGQITVTIARPFEYLGIPNGSRVDVWALNNGETVPRIRGKVNTPEAILDLSEKHTLIAYGRMEDMAHVLVDKLMLYTGGADLSVFAAELASDYYARRPGLVQILETRPTNVFLERLDATNALVRDALDSIFQQAGRNVVWGWDIEPDTGFERFYLRPRAAATAYQFIVGDNVKLLSKPAELQPVTNAVKISGGPARYPQLVTNPSFGTPALPSVTSGSLIQDGGFEEYGGIHNPGDNAYPFGGAPPHPPLSSNWHVINGASVNRFHDDPRHNVTAHNGGYYLLLDHATEEAWQEVAVTPGVLYKAQLYAALETNAGTLTTAQLILEGRDAGGSVIESYSRPVAPPSTAWIGGQASTVLAADGIELSRMFLDASIVTCRLRIVADNGSSQHGIAIDDVVFFGADAVGQVGWEIYEQHPGNPLNKLLAVDWSCRGAAADGSYGVRLTTVADSTHQVRLAIIPGLDSQAAGNHFKPAPNQALTCDAKVKLPTEFNASAADASLQYTEWDNRGNILQTQHTTLTIAADGAWHSIVLNVTAHRDQGTSATVELAFMDSAVYDVGWVSVRDAAANGEFLRGTQFERYVSVTDADLALDPTGLVHNSIGTYGLREAALSNADIVDWNADAIAYMVAYFGQKAVELKRPRIELTHEPNVIVTPGSAAQVAVSGLDGPAVVSWPARVVYKWAKGALGVTIEGDATRPTFARLLLGASAGSGGGTTSTIAAVAVANAGSGNGSSGSSGLADLTPDPTGTYGDGANVSQVTVNAQGLVTLGVSVAISITQAAVTGLVTALAAINTSITALWAAIAAITTGDVPPIVVSTAAYTATPANPSVLFDNAGGVTVTMPLAAAGQPKYAFKALHGLTVVPIGGGPDTIDGGASASYGHDAEMWPYTGTGWISEHIP